MTTVLIADDSAIVRKLLRKRLETILRGYHATVIDAADGEAALNSLLNDEVHLALLDFNMPKLNGVQVIERFKAANTGKKPYLFMVTTEASSEIVMKAIQAGAHNYLVKNKLDTAFDDKVRKVLLGA
ncbi:MAG: response regulator [Planctomycetota bacterium]|nr:MAG: response regulator [Planctomycetota bacterium]